MPSLPCKIKLGKLSRHLTTDFFNTLSHKQSFELGLPSPIGADGRLDPDAVKALAERAGDLLLDGPAAANGANGSVQGPAPD